MENFKALRDLPKNKTFKKGDVLVVFGEVFDKGYVNGLIEEAERIGMTIVSGTVGRRNEEQELRKLNSEEISSKKYTNIINIPLEAGFDLEKDSSGKTACDQLQGVKRDQWEEVKLDWSSIQESREKAFSRFVEQTKKFMKQLEKDYLQDSSCNIHFAHTMAGGIPRAKILMPLLNRVFKGSGKRYLSSKKFWDSDIGKLCSMNFDDVTAKTFEVLIKESASLREKHPHVSYSAYGYHGCEPLMGDQYLWQSYAPYLQGWAKIMLEDIAKENWKSGVKCQVFNSPEILTNSSSVFMGVEVCLYPLLRALKFENSGKNTKIHEQCLSMLEESTSLEYIDEYTQKYMNPDPEKQQLDWSSWPQHNTEDQMAAMREASEHLIDLHKDRKELITFPLSEVVFKTSGKLILDEASSPREPVWWIGHDVVSKCHLEFFE